MYPPKEKRLNFKKQFLQLNRGSQFAEGNVKYFAESNVQMILDTWPDGNIVHVTVNLRSAESPLQPVVAVWIAGMCGIVEMAGNLFHAVLFMQMHRRQRINKALDTEFRLPDLIDRSFIWSAFPPPANSSRFSRSVLHELLKRFWQSSYKFYKFLSQRDGVSPLASKINDRKFAREFWRTLQIPENRKILINK